MAEFNETNDAREISPGPRGHSIVGTEVSDDGRRAPALWDAGWRPGNYVPYAMVYSWHSADVEAAQSAGSSATTGYSSGGFSGGGGSSSY